MAKKRGTQPRGKRGGEDNSVPLFKREQKLISED